MSENKFKKINPKTNTIYRGDNLDIMLAMPSDTFDLVYIDPPFYTNRKFIDNMWGDKESIQDINEIHKYGFDDRKQYFENNIKTDATGLAAYLEWMRYRLVELHRLLKPTGALYLHIDHRAVHYLKIILDEIFGYKNFKNEIIWKRGTVKGAKAVGNQFARNHDTILFYSKSEEYTFNRQHVPYEEEYVEQRYRKDDNDGRGPYTDQPIGTRSKKAVDKFRKEGRIYVTKNGTERIKFYLNELSGIALDDVWVDISEVNAMSKEKTGWPTQKPVSLLERIINASTNEGDVIFDCFAGCGTSMHAAHNLKRKWVGIDISPKAIEVNKARLEQNGARVEVVDEDDLEIKLGSKPRKLSEKVA